jgi:hypothetical protein
MCATNFYGPYNIFLPNRGFKGGGGCWTLVDVCSGQDGGRGAVDLLPVLCSGTHRLTEILAAVCPEQGIDIRR